MPSSLIQLAAEIARIPEMAIFGEGNVSGRSTPGRFFVKASGTRLAALAPEHLVEVEAAPLLEAVERGDRFTDARVEALLLEARVRQDDLKPSVESLFHAWLLAQEGVEVVAHTHPVAVNQILCSPAAALYARERLFPDQVVYCGAESVLVPYVDPGLALARAIADAVTAFRGRRRGLPRLILLQNHGAITVGRSPAEALAALHMAEKAARVFVGAAALGGPVFMPAHQVARIDERSDEHYRQRMLRP